MVYRKVVASAVNCFSDTIKCFFVSVRSWFFNYVLDFCGGLVVPSNFL